MHVRPQFASDEDAKQGKADLKPIIELKVGDEVLSWAEWKKPEDAQSYERITDVFITPSKQRTTVKITLEDGKTLTPTDGHPLKSADGLRDAILLKKGGKLLLKDSANAADKEHEVTIAELQHATEPLTTFNLEVVHAHTYFVGTNGVLVHNGNRPGIKLGSHWRREYEKRTGLDWPKTDDGKNYHAHHKKPLADDGEDIYENIEPLEPKAHGKHHEQDRKRWGKKAMQVIDKKFMVRIENMQDSDPIETEILTRRVEEAKEHLLSFKWFRGIDSLWFAGGFSQVAVFFAEIDSIRYDKELWVVVGDLPPAHLVTDDIPDVEEALLCYVDHMREWVSHVKQGKSVEDCIPVNVEPTIEHAEMLETRLNFIESEYLPSLGDGARVVS